MQPIDKHKSAALEEAGILETDYDTHRRVGDGISGGALPPSWEVIDSELYAIYAYLRRRVEVMKATGATQRCLILSDCKAALEAIEREYRGQTPHNPVRVRGYRVNPPPGLTRVNPPGLTRQCRPTHAPEG